MAEFEPIFKQTIENGGGFKLHKVEGDSGGWTYAEIAENFHPDWPGWAILRECGEDDPRLTPMVREFYIQKYWNKMNGDQICSQETAASIFDFGVNAGLRTSVKLAQRVVGVISDGIVGPKTLAALNAVDGELFAYKFTIVKIFRYAAIVNNNRSQLKFLLGWINRSLKPLQQ